MGKETFFFNFLYNLATKGALPIWDAKDDKSGSIQAEVWSWSLVGDEPLAVMQKAYSLVQPEQTGTHGFLGFKV